MLQHHIQTIELSSAQASVRFNSIPQDYSDLVVLMSARSSQSSRSTAITVAFNNDNNASYSFIKLIGYDSGQVYAGTGSGTPAQVPEIDVTGNSATANTFGNTSFYITNYTGATEKSVVVEQTSENNSTSAYVLGINSYRYSSANPITSIQFGLQGHNYMAGSSISLYGVKRGDDKLTKVSPVATGGTVTTSGGYTIHTFNTSGTFVANKDIEAEYLVIAGGGGGAALSGGGGGAGGYRSSVVGEASGGGASAESKLSLASGTSYTVTVGAGGAGAPGDVNRGSSGVNSTFSTITSIGGGGGGYDDNAARLPQTGGSGGGRGFDLGGTGAAGTANQGFAGGNNAASSVGPNYASAGGGGASSVGGNATTSSSGNGGSGVTSSITGSAIARAGGGGGGFNGANFGTATAGGGNGGQVFSGITASPGTSNTGGGGGAGRTSGGAGGSGVVIIRYLTP